MKQEHIEHLRQQYSRIERVDPSGRPYQELCEFLDAAPDRLIEQLATANIKWVSMLANTRRIRRKQAGTWSLLGPYHDLIIEAAHRIVDKM